MKEELQRIAIAEACGWTQVKARPNSHYHEVLCGLVPDADMMDSQGADKHYFKIPDYLSDLNAMHEAEKVLAPKEKVKYFWSLLDKTPYDGPVIDGLDGDNGGFEFITMSAAQRAEAFLKTLNLWKEE
jgi:hypothetical protein